MTNFLTWLNATAPSLNNVFMVQENIQNPMQLLC